MLWIYDIRLSSNIIILKLCPLIFCISKQECSFVGDAFSWFAYDWTVHYIFEWLLYDTDHFLIQPYCYRNQELAFRYSSYIKDFKHSYLIVFLINTIPIANWFHTYCNLGNDIRYIELFQIRISRIYLQISLSLENIYIYHIH